MGNDFKKRAVESKPRERIESGVRGAPALPRWGAEAEETDGGYLAAAEDDTHAEYAENAEK